MTWRVLAVALLALLAGCTGAAGSEFGPERSTMTPAPDVEQSPDGTVPIPVEQIPDRHRYALANIDFTATETIRVGLGENATVERDTTYATDPDRERHLFDDEVIAVDADSRLAETDVWWNGERTYRRTTDANGSDQYSQSVGPPRRGLLVDGRFDALFEGVSLTSIERRDNVTIIGGGVDADDVPRPAGITDVENATMSVRVGHDGVVDEMVVGYTATFRDDGRLRVRYAYRVTDVGTTTLDPPRWLDHVETSRIR